MLILLAAYCVPSIRPHIRAEVIDLGQHLERLLARWLWVPGPPVSPSVEQAISWIITADDLIRKQASLGQQSK
jgi:hypothetical protein